MVRRSSVFERPEVAKLFEHWTAEAIQGVLDDILGFWGCLDLTTAIHWRWNPRLKTTLGRAIFEDMVVELNPLLLARYPGQVRHVLIHEVAHLVVQRLHGTQSPHGSIWKSYMSKAGESPAATHNLDVSDLRRKRTKKRILHRSLWGLPKIF